MIGTSKVLLLSLLVLNSKCWAGIQMDETEDNDFAEFEDYEEDNIKLMKEQPITEKTVTPSDKTKEKVYETDVDSTVEVYNSFILPSN